MASHPGNAGGRDDEQLLADHCRGERASFAELVRRYERQLYCFLFRLLGERGAAEDVCQETLLQVHRSAGDFDTELRFRPWFFTIAANKARDLIAFRARRPALSLHAAGRSRGR